MKEIKKLQTVEREKERIPKGVTQRLTNRKEEEVRRDVRGKKKVKITSIVEFFLQK